MAAVPHGVAFLHSAEPRVEPPPGSTRSDYRVAVFDHAGAQMGAFPVTVDSSQSFFCCFAARSGDAFFVAGGQDGLFLLEMSAGGTQRTRAKWGVEGSPVGLGVAIDRRSIVGASAQPTDATFASYRSVVLRLN
jgi:hypothetical protein